MWKRTLTPEQLNEFGQSAQKNMVTYLGIQFTELTKDALTATMPISDKVLQPYGILHGGASCVLAESVGSTAANLCIDFNQQYCVGLSIYTNHIKTATKGMLRAVAKNIHLGRSTQIWQIDIYDDKSRLISSTRLTMAVLDR